MSPGRALRVGARLAGLAVVLAWGAAAIVLVRRDPARVQHRMSRWLLRIFGVELSVEGPPPAAGLIVCNHLGYLDILALASTAPTVFVAKSEVEAWPVFGWFARRGGSIFVRRERAQGALDSARRIAAALDAGRRVVLFPEGTSSGGREVLPFKSSLLETARWWPARAAAIEYALDPGEGDPAELVCYWRDMSFGPHLLGLLGLRRVRARLAFAARPEAGGDRKELAGRLRAAVAALKAGAPPALRPDAPARTFCAAASPSGAG